MNNLKENLGGKMDNFDKLIRQKSEYQSIRDDKFKYDSKVLRILPSDLSDSTIYLS